MILSFERFLSKIRDREKDCLLGKVYLDINNVLYVIRHITLFACANTVTSFNVFCDIINFPTLINFQSNKTGNITLINQSDISGTFLIILSRRQHE